MHGAGNDTMSDSLAELIEKLGRDLRLVPAGEECRRRCGEVRHLSQARPPHRRQAQAPQHHTGLEGEPLAENT